MKIHTIGHSTRTIEDFIDVLKHYSIELVIDVRRFPTSKKFPHFNKENLEQSLHHNGIEYLHYPELGGLGKSVTRLSQKLMSSNKRWKNF